MKALNVLLGVLVLASVVLPDGAAAQSKQRGRVIVSDHDCCYYNRFTLDPYAGGLKDAYDIGADDDFGYLVGFRVGYQLGSRTRLLGNVAYSNTENVADPQGLQSYYIYDNVWVMTTGGGEFDVVPGRTSAALGLQAGAGWRKLDLESTVGTPVVNPLDDRNFTAYEVLLPSLTARHRLSTRAAVMVSLQDYIFNFLEGPAQHSPALTLGLSFR